MSQNKEIRGMMDDMRKGMIEPLLRMFGVQPDYTMESLELIEAKINELYPEGHKPMETTLVPFGFYLGETIVRNVSTAKWNYDTAEYLSDVEIEFDSEDEMKMKVYPFRRISKFWADRTDGLAVMFRMVLAMSAGALDPEKMQDRQWVHMPNGDAMRVIRADKE